MDTADKIIFGIFATVMAAVIGMQAVWLGNHIDQWNKQEARFMTAHEQGRHAEAIAIYEAKHDVPWSPYNLRLHRKPGTHYSLTAGQSYEELGQDRKARLLYLRTIGWTETQFQAYCALNQDCNPRALALSQN